jgi:two-component system, cell cycle response regulator
MTAVVKRFPVNRGAALALVLLAVCVALFAVDYQLQLAHGRLGSFLDDWLYNGVLVGAGLLCIWAAFRSRRERLAWALLGTAVVVWGVGDTYYTIALSGLDPIPYPSPADWLWLAFYPLAYAALGALVRARIGHFTLTMWLDGLIGALVVAALAVAVVFQTVLTSTSGSPVAVATNLAYPLADALLLAFVVGILAMTGWRPGSAWAFIGAGLLLFAVSDSTYLYQAAEGTYVEGRLVDVGWLAAVVMLAFAAWSKRPTDARRMIDGWAAVVAPVVFGLGAVAIEVYDHFARVNVLALALASGALLLVIVRMALTFIDNVHMLRASRAEATTDPLTSIGNRRKLLLDLEAAVEHPDLEVEPRVLVFFDLDGFKGYNDQFGHSAGDALLRRVATRLAQSVPSTARAYRLGGDEFCVLALGRPDEGEGIAARAAIALTEHGEGFAIRSSFGWVAIPLETRSVSTLLKLADQRMYAQKASRPTVALQTRRALVSMLRERDPGLASHLDGVADLADAVGRKLGLDDTQLERLRGGAELHDVGKSAIPEAILTKAGPLDDVEWAFIKRHTLIGERIVAAAQALEPVARIVRSTHERWDGSGYPDELAGEEIPLESRIITACDAYDAMVADRSYRGALSDRAARAQLRACAGTQFDPVVVDALVSVLDEIGVRVPARSVA